MKSAAIFPQKGLRADILVELKKSQPLTAKDLAKRHGVTPNAIRRHLKELEVDQLIEYVRQQKGRGAPTFTYRLTHAGEAVFPKRYEEQLTGVLTYLEQRGGRQEIPEVRGSTAPRARSRTSCGKRSPGQCARNRGDSLRCGS